MNGSLASCVSVSMEWCIDGIIVGIIVYVSTDGKGFTFLHTSGAKSKTIKGIAQRSVYVAVPTRAKVRRAATPVIQPVPAPALRQRAPPAVVVLPCMTGPFKGPVCGTTLPHGFCSLRQGHLGFCG